MDVRVVKIKGKAEFGYTINDVVDFLGASCLVDDDLIISEYLKDKGEIDEDGNVTGEMYGLVMVTDRVVSGMFKETTEKYLFIPCNGIVKLVRDLIKEYGKL